MTLHEMYRQIHLEVKHVPPNGFAIFLLEELKETGVIQPWAPRSSCESGGEIMEASINRASIGFEDAGDKSKLLHRKADEIACIGVSVEAWKK